MDYSKLTAKKKELDGYPPLQELAVQNLDEWFRIELTYTSNALEGNTLTRQETALVVEKGLTVGGKSLREHLEATNHAQALDFVRIIVKRPKFAVTEGDILHIHELILKGIDDANAGRYRTIQVRISGSAVILPNPMKVPSLIEAFVKNLPNEAVHPVHLAANAHYELVTIHPFVDGNGRTGRLLMNLLLISQGYPPAIIQPKDRLAYINSLEKAQLGGSKEDYFELIANSVDRSLDIYLRAARGEDEKQSESHEKLLKIGEVAKAAHETNATIRFWTQEGLLDVAQVSKSGYQLYGRDVITRIAKIKDLKAQRYTLQEIRKFLD